MKNLKRISILALLCFAFTVLMQNHLSAQNFISIHAAETLLETEFQAKEAVLNGMHESQDTYNTLKYQANAYAHILALINDGSDNLHEAVKQAIVEGDYEGVTMDQIDDGTLNVAEAIALKDHLYQLLTQ